MTRQPKGTNLIRALHWSLKLAVVSPRRREAYHDHSHPNRSQLIGVKACKCLPKCCRRMTETHQFAPMLPSTKHEPLPPRGHPRTLEPLR